MKCLWGVGTIPARNFIKMKFSRVLVQVLQEWAIPEPGLGAGGRGSSPGPGPATGPRGRSHPLAQVGCIEWGHAWLKHNEKIQYKWGAGHHHPTTYTEKSPEMVGFPSDWADLGAELMKKTRGVRI